MPVIKFFSLQPVRAWHELVAFNWRKVLQISTIGSWPALPRQVFLLFSAVLFSGLVLTVLVVFKPTVSVGDVALLETLKNKISAQQAENSSVLARQLELQRHSYVPYVLLQHAPAGKLDITKALDVVRAAAHGSGVRLMIVSPQKSPESEQVDLQLSARMTLASLSSFWFELVQTGFGFSINAIALESTEKQEIFELNMQLLVTVVSEIDWSEHQYKISHVTGHDSDQYISGLCRTELCTVQTEQNIKKPEGFLLRSESQEIFFLVRDEKGHLTGVMR